MRCGSDRDGAFAGPDRGWGWPPSAGVRSDEAVTTASAATTDDRKAKRRDTYTTGIVPYNADRGRPRLRRGIRLRRTRRPQLQRPSPSSFTKAMEDMRLRRTGRETGGEHAYRVEPRHHRAIRPDDTIAKTQPAFPSFARVLPDQYWPRVLYSKLKDRIENRHFHRVED